ncbi:hypothetical protein RvY_11258 [Ramazzottius varieornatus]|uniref:Uncharacterized protein n=1 Tax=Ramazzottius varieornatus TaxID=947166 RepID=A0A1D1VHY4_RAMVA|nr:hypothetical protein RvY_11258 [Ramazzottius varieornatus]
MMSSGLIQQDFIPECLERGSFLTAPTFERFSVVVGKANFFLAEKRSITIKSCETIRHRVKKGQLMKANCMSFTQSGSEIDWYYVDGLRLWFTSSNSNDDKKSKEALPVQIGYFHVLPKCGKESPVQDTMDSLTQKLTNQLASQPLAGRLLAVEAIEVRGVKLCELLDPDAATGNPKPQSDAVMTFLRVWYECDPQARSRVSVGLATFVPELNLEKCVTLISGKEYMRLHKGSVERHGRVMEYVNSWKESMPENSRILNIKSYSTRTDEYGQYDCHSTYKKVHRRPAWGHYHLRFIRVFFTAILNEDDGPPLYPSVIPRITCKLFLPALVQRGFFNRGSPFEPKKDLLARLEKWTSFTGANIISVETVAYKAFTGAEGKYGLDVMCTRDMYHHQKDSGNVPTPECYVIGYRVFMEGLFGDPDGFEWPPSIDGPRAPKEDACSIQ